ncbi:MAG: hypothetical protein ACKO54_05375, partial [Alphaproteobacteria bacterium]
DGPVAARHAGNEPRNNCNMAALTSRRRERQLNFYQECSACGGAIKARLGALALPFTAQKS